MKQLKLIKIPGNPSAKELTQWTLRFEHHMPSDEELEELGIEVQTIDCRDEPALMVIKGVPTEDLEDWAEMFEEAQHDPDFKVFTDADVQIERLPLGKDDLTLVVGEYCQLIKK